MTENINVENQKTFVHLHAHTEYSLLDGAARVKDVVKRAKELGMPAVAITDHGAMFGVLKLYNECKKAGINPVIGCEVYVAPRSRFDKEAGVDNRYYHLVLLAENQQGYRNLCKIVSAGYLEGYYYKPRVDYEIIRKYKDGLICLSACLAGEVLQAFLDDDVEKAYDVAREYLDIFGPDHYYIELQDHGMEEQKRTNPQLIKLAKDLGIGLVATNDNHYVYADDADAHEILLCVQTGKTRDDENRMTFPSDQFYLKSREEMELLFGEYPEALDNTVKIAERCHVNLDSKTVDIPEYDVPEGFNIETYLRYLCEEGLKERYPEIAKEIQDRLDFELNIINTMKFPGYFLIVWDMINFCKENGIRTGPGRGSAAGSLVAYSLGITNIDPLHYGLIFERFLNPERVSMPDIDSDFCVIRRGEVIDYLVEKYGADKVGQIVTFGTLKAKMVVRDIGRVLGMSVPDVNKIAKLIPADLKMTVKLAIEESDELRGLYENDPLVKELLDYSMKLEGLPRHTGTHAAGVVIAPAPVTDYMPALKIGENILTTQFEKEPVEEQGLLKMDILGLRTLTVIGDALDNIKQSQGIDIDIDKIPLDDAKTYEMLAAAETGGVFQLESDGMRAYLKQLKPDRIEDVIAMVALYRPGPMDFIDDFIKRKQGVVPVEYPHQLLEPVLKETYGVMIYQEQVMQSASVLAGFSLGQSDMLRRIMGKKKPELLPPERERFVAGCKSVNNIDEKKSSEIFDIIESFAGYGFNKSHAAAYGVVSYQTAWLRKNYPAEFMAAMLTSFMEVADKITVYIEECHHMGLKILPPDINESSTNFTVINGNIRFGLAAIKGMGREVVDEIIAEREKNGKFSSIGELARRLPLNKRVIEAMIKAGALDCFGAKRSQLLAVFEQALDLGRRYAQEKASDQISLFDFGMEEQREVEVELPNIPEFSPLELLAMEKESIGFFVSGHPLDEYAEVIKNVTSHNVEKLSQAANRSKVRVAGLVAQNKPRLTKKGESMSIFSLEDKYGSVRCLAFPKCYSECRDILINGNVVLAEGRMQVEDDDSCCIVLEAVHKLDDMEFMTVPKSQELPEEKEEPVNEKGYPRRKKKVEEHTVGKLFVRLPNSECLPEVRELAADYPGQIELIPYYNDTKRYHNNLGIRVNVAIVDELRLSYGEHNVVLKLQKESVN